MTQEANHSDARGTAAQRAGNPQAAQIYLFIIFFQLNARTMASSRCYFHRLTS